MGKILRCEGYQMFEGIMEIVPKTDKLRPFTVEGTWLFKPEYNCWYCKGSSYPSDICKVIEVK